MVRGVRWYLVSSVVLGALGVLAGCSGRYFAERETWRREAEVACLNSAAVQEGAGKVRIKAISGPGACGADYPIRVSSLGDSAPLAFGSELRPPANVPNASMPQRWPGAGTRPAPYEGPQSQAYPSSAYPSSVVESRPLGAPGGGAQPYEPRGSGEPLSLDPRGPVGAVRESSDFRRPYGAAPPAPRAPVPAPMDASAPAYDFSPEPYERRRAIDEPRPRRQADPPLAATRPAQRQSVPPLGPRRAPLMSAGPVSVTPSATLACPLVSALDRWVATSVQPAALRWFGQPVVEIRQISAYSCRGMNGNPNARISEHAFGNALDIASFMLADGRKITVKDGWRGTPEEQGFLRDVQGSACDAFTTVLAPGSNVYHYDHIHVDLMRRSGGRRACDPDAIPGEEVAARARGRYAGKRETTGSIMRPSAKRAAPTSNSGERVLPLAVPGEDGED
jgi:hypothetical protein